MKQQSRNRIKELGHVGLTRVFLLFSIIAVLSACSKDDDEKLPEPKYEFHEVCMQWLADEATVDEFMKLNYTNLKKDEFNKPNEREYIIYTSKAGDWNVSYVFEDHKLKASELCYYGLIEHFDEFKNDIEKRYNLTLQTLEENIPGQYDTPKNEKTYYDKYPHPDEEYGCIFSLYMRYASDGKKDIMRLLMTSW